MEHSVERDQPLTPAGRLFLQPQLNQIINCAIAGKHPIDVAAVKAQVQNSVMLKHPRFCSIIVRDSLGREHWRKTEVDIDRHVVIRLRPVSEDPSISDDEAVNDYMADLSVSSPLSEDKPLWEIHILAAHRTAVFRVHHALGDGISLMSLLLTCCRRVDDPEQLPSIGGVGTSSSPLRRRWSAWSIVKVVWYTLVFVMEFVLRGLWLRDRTTALSGGSGVEDWPRGLATARLRLEDMKTVKRAVADATINDVLFGVVSSGLSMYISTCPKALPEGLKMTGVAMVNLRPQPGLQDLTQLMGEKSRPQWGNKFGILLLPVYYHKDRSNPLQFVKRAKAMIDQKKLSFEAPCSYRIGNLIMSLFGPKVAGILNYRIICNTTFTISNVVGPREEITLGGNPVKHIRATSSSLPHAITLHMVSYAGVADLQILVAKDIIPQPKLLAKCFEDALHQMKEAAEAITSSKLT
ncbi:wax ester synthase/diacylglycerol acyltransferase 11-like isoform X1 [Primulina eburnea]|uniref:wax ester synthase/diacylglycerol acyltransferase 11-like isoform X1 n=1 Tax=Primulina eburnea TaxID=1245227 RepID=UPI003C6BE89F